MEDRTFELLSKLYGEFSEFRKDTNKRLDKIEISLGNNIKPDIKAVYDGYTQIYSKQQEHDKRFDALEDRMDKHDVEIRVIKNAK